MPLTVISHFWNEEFLMPYWLRHHYPLFDHGILIDYASTDRTVEIIRELAPRWDIRLSANGWFDAHDCDQEVMAIERELSGWKIVLNTTEFLLCHDLPWLIGWMERLRKEVWGIWPFDLAMVDVLSEREEEVTPAPLFFQKHWGYHAVGERSRVLHRSQDGSYSVGRHSSQVVPKVLDDNLFLLWFGWCPIRYVKARKLQIQNRIPPRDRALGLGRQHFLSSQELEDAYLREAAKAYNLLDTYPRYHELMQVLSRG